MINFLRKVIYSHLGISLFSTLSKIFSLRLIIKGGKNSFSINESIFFSSKIFIHGFNNQINFLRRTKFKNFKLIINGDNNTIIINEFSILSNLEIVIEGSSNTFILGKNSKLYGGHIALTEQNSKIIIGENCLFSKDVEIRNGDSHSIYDLVTHKRVNNSKPVFIGNNVWVGAHVVILKGVTVGDNTILANSAVITKSFQESNVIIGGFPAKIIKKDVYWKSERTH